MVAITAEDERISEDRRGHFSLLFSNSNNLEIYEIEGIFTEFGKVLNVRQANDKRGIHFVSFGSYEEAKNAVEGLIDDPDIRLRVFQNKGKQLSNNRRRENFNDFRCNRNEEYNNSWINGSQYQNATRDLSHRNNENYNHSWINGSHHRDRRSAPRDLSYRFDKARSIEGRINPCDDYEARDECVMKEILKDENVMDMTIHRWHRVSGKKVMSVSSESVSVDVDDDDDESEGRKIYDDSSSLNNDMEQHIAYVDDRLTERINENINAIIEKSEQVIENVIINEQSDVIATVDENESILSLNSVEMIIEEASEVIVGNIDLTKTNEAYLLHLFDKYEPIAVSQLIPITPHDDLGYCRIYFKNYEVAVKVEMNFDKLGLDGRQIIVQRPNRLLEASLQQI